MNATVSVNGRITDGRDAVVSVFDHGFLYGEGVYETLRTYSALAMQQALREGAFEGAMRNSRGELSECTTANLFVVRAGAVLTPPLDAGLLPGITREVVFELGRSRGIDVREQTLRDDDLFDADEAFLTSTTRELVPIVTVGERGIGSGRPGPVTGRLLDAYRQLTWAA